MVESLFTNQTPDTPDAADGNTIVTATVVRFAVPGQVLGIRWYGPAAVGVTPIGGLFTITSEAAGAELARATFPGFIAADWNEVTFSSPVDVEASVDYVVAVWADHYVFTGNFFAGALTNGNITGPADGAPFKNGRFLFPAADLAFPSQNFNKSNYFVDVLFEAEQQPSTATLDLTAPAATFTAEAEAHSTATLDLTAPAATMTAAATSHSTAVLVAAAPAATMTAAGEANSTATLTAVAAAATMTLYGPDTARTADATHYSGPQRATHYGGAQTAAHYS